MVGNVNRRLVAWLLSVPLMLGGTEVAHWLAYRLVYPDSWERSQVLAQSGHGYFSLLPLLGGIAGRARRVGLFLHGRAVARGGAGRVQGGPVGAVRCAAAACVCAAGAPREAHPRRDDRRGRARADVHARAAAAAPVRSRGLSPRAVPARGRGPCGARLTGRAGRRRRSLPWAPRPRFSLDLVPVRVPALAGGHAERGPPA